LNDKSLAYDHRTAKDTIQNINSIEINRIIPEWDAGGTTYPEEMIMITQNYKEMQQIMSNYVGIVRSNLRLEKAQRRLEIIFTETEELFKKSILSQKLCELRNLIKVGYLIIKMAQNLHESRGLHYTLDYPKKGSVSEF